MDTVYNFIEKVRTAIDLRNLIPQAMMYYLNSNPLVNRYLDLSGVTYELERREDSGTVRFLNITFRPDGLEQLGLPVTLVSSYIGSLDLKLPDSYFTTFASLLFGNDGQALDTALVLDSVTITVQPRDNLDGASVQSGSASASAAPTSRISAADRVAAAMAASEVNKMRRLGVHDTSEGDVLVLKAVEVLTRQMSLRLHQLHVRYVDTRLRPSQPFAVGLVLQDFIAGPLSSILPKATDGSHVGATHQDVSPQASQLAELFSSDAWSSMLGSLLGGTLPPRLKSFDRKAAAVRGLGLYIQQLSSGHGARRGQTAPPDRPAMPLPDELAFVNASIGDTPVTMHDWVLSPLSAAATYTLQNGQLFNEHCPPAQRLSVHIPHVDLRLDQEQLRSACVVAAYLKNYQMHRRYSRGWMPARRVAEALLLDPLQHTPSVEAWRQAAETAAAASPASGATAGQGAAAQRLTKQRPVRRKRALLHQACRYHELVAGVFSRILPAELLSSAGVQRQVYTNLRKLSLEGLVTAPLPQCPSSPDAEHLAAWAAGMTTFLRVVVQLAGASDLSIAPPGTDQTAASSRVSSTRSVPPGSPDSPGLDFASPGSTSASPHRQTSVRAAQGTGLMRQFSTSSVSASSPGPAPAVSSILRRQASVRVIDRALLDELSAAEGEADLMAIALANVQLKLRQVMTARQRWLFCIQGVMHDLSSEVEKLRRAARSKHFSEASGAEAAAGPSDDTLDSRAPAKAIQDLFISPVDGVALGLVDGMWRQNYVAAFKLLYKSYSQLNGILVDSITLPGFSIVECNSHSRDSKLFAAQMRTGDSASMKLSIDATSMRSSTASLASGAAPMQAGLPAVCNASVSAFDGRLDVKWVADVPAQRLDAFKDGEMLWAPVPANAAAKAGAQQIVSFLDKHMSPEYILYFRRLAHNELLLEYYLARQRARQEAEIRRIAGLLSRCVPCSVSCTSAAAAEEVEAGDEFVTDRQSRERMALLAAVPLSTGANIRSLAHGTRAVSSGLKPVQVPGSDSLTDDAKRVAELRVRRAINGSADGNDDGAVSISTLQLHTPSLDKPALLALLQDKSSLAPELARSLDTLLPRWRELVQSRGRTPEVLQELNQALRRRALPTGFAFSLPGPNAMTVYGCVESVSVCAAPYVLAPATSTGATRTATMQLPVSCAPQALFTQGDTAAVQNASTSVQQAVAVFSCRLHGGEASSSTERPTAQRAIATPHSREHRAILPGGEMFGASSGPRDVLGWMAESVLALEAYCFDPMLRARLARCMLCPTQVLAALQTSEHPVDEPVFMQHISFGHFREESTATTRNVALSSVEAGVPAEHVHGARSVLRNSDKLLLSKLVKLSSLDNTALLDVDDQSLPWSYSLRNASVSAAGLRVSLVETHQTAASQNRTLSKLHASRAANLPVPRGAFFCLDIQQVAVQLRQLKAQHARAMLRIARLRILQDQRALTEQADAAFFGADHAHTDGAAASAATPAGANPFSNQSELEPSVAHGPLMTTLDLAGRASDFFVVHRPTALWATHAEYLANLPGLALRSMASTPGAEMERTWRVLTCGQIGIEADAAVTVLLMWIYQATADGPGTGDWAQHAECLQQLPVELPDEAPNQTPPNPMHAFCAAAAVKTLISTSPPRQLLERALGISGDDGDAAPPERESLSDWARSTVSTAWDAAASRFYALCPSPLQLLHDDEYSNLLDGFASSDLLPGPQAEAVRQALAAWRGAMMLMQGTVWSADKMRPVFLASKEQAFAAWRAWVLSALGLDSRAHAAETAPVPESTSWWRTGATEQPQQAGPVPLSQLTDLGRYLVAEHHALALLLKASDTRHDSPHFASSVEAGGHAGGRQLAKAICDANGELLSIIEGVVLHHLLPHFVRWCWDPAACMLRPVASHLALGSLGPSVHDKGSSGGNSHPSISLELERFEYATTRAIRELRQHSEAKGSEICAAASRGSARLVQHLANYDLSLCPAVEVFVEKSPMPLPAAAFADGSRRLFADNAELVTQQCMDSIASLDREITVDEVRAPCEVLQTGAVLVEGSPVESGCHADVLVGQQRLSVSNGSAQDDTLGAFLHLAAGESVFAWHNSFAEPSAVNAQPLAALLPSAVRSCVLSTARRQCSTDAGVVLLKIGGGNSSSAVRATRVLHFAAAATARSAALLQSKHFLQAFLQWQQQDHHTEPSSAGQSAGARSVEIRESAGIWAGDLTGHLPLQMQFAAEQHDSSARQAGADWSPRDVLSMQHDGFIHRDGSASMRHPEQLCDAFRDASAVAVFTPRHARISGARANSKHAVGRPFTRFEGGVGSVSVSIHPATVGSYLGIFLQMRPFLAAAYIGQLSLLPGAQDDSSSLGSSLQLIKRTRQLRRSYQRKVRSLAAERHSAGDSAPAHQPAAPTPASRQAGSAAATADAENNDGGTRSSSVLVNFKVSHLSFLFPLSCVRGEDEGLVSFLPPAPVAGFAVDSATNGPDSSLPTLQLLQLRVEDLQVTSGQDELSSLQRGQLISLARVCASSQRFTDISSLRHFTKSSQSTIAASSILGRAPWSQVPLSASAGVLVSNSELLSLHGFHSFVCTKARTLESTLTQMQSLTIDLSAGGVLDAAQVSAEWGCLRDFVRFVDETSQLLQGNASEDSTQSQSMPLADVPQPSAGAHADVVEHSFSLHCLQVHLGRPCSGALTLGRDAVPALQNFPGSGHRDNMYLPLLTFEAHALHVSLQTRSTPHLNELPQVNSYSLHGALQQLYSSQLSSLTQCSARVGAVLLWQTAVPSECMGRTAAVDINSGNCISPVLATSQKCCIFALHSLGPEQPGVELHFVASKQWARHEVTAHAVTRHEAETTTAALRPGHSRRASHVPNLQAVSGTPEDDESGELASTPPAPHAALLVQSESVRTRWGRSDAVVLLNVASLSAQLGTDSVAVLTSLEKQGKAVLCASRALKAGPKARFAVMRQWVNGKFLTGHDTIADHIFAPSAEVSHSDAPKPAIIVPVCCSNSLQSAQVRINSVHASLRHNTRALVTTRAKQVVAQVQEAEMREVSALMSRSLEGAWWLLPHLPSLQAAARSHTASHGESTGARQAYPGVREHSHSTLKIGAALDSFDIVLGRPEVFVLAWHASQRADDRPDPLRRNGQWLPTAMPAGAMTSSSPFHDALSSSLESVSRDAVWDALSELEEATAPREADAEAWWSGVPHGVAQISLSGFSGSGVTRSSANTRHSSMFSFVRTTAEDAAPLLAHLEEASTHIQQSKQRALVRPAVLSDFDACFGSLSVSAEQDVSVLPWDAVSACYPTDAAAARAEAPDDKPHGFAWMFGLSAHREFVVPVLRITAGAEMTPFLGRQARAWGSAGHDSSHIPLRLHATEVQSPSMEGGDAAEGSGAALLRNISVQMLHMRANTDPTAVRMLAHTAKLLSQFVQASKDVLATADEDSPAHDAWVALLLHDCTLVQRLQSWLEGAAVAPRETDAAPHTEGSEVSEVDDDLSALSVADGADGNTSPAAATPSEADADTDAPQRTSLAVTVQTETMVADLSVLATGVQRFWGAPPPSSVMKVAQDIHSELARGGSDVSGSSSPYAPDALKHFPSLPRNYKWSAASSKNRLHWLHEVACGAVVPHCQLVQYSVTLGACVDPAQMHEMWLTSAEDERAQLQLTEVHMAAGAVFLAYVAPSPLLENVRGIPEHGAEADPAHLPCIWPSHVQEATTNSSGGVRAEPLRGAPLSATWAVPTGLQRPASTPSPTRYVVYPQWWQPGAPLPQHVYSYNTPPWAASAFAGVRPFRQWAAAWLQHSADSTTDEVHSIPTGALSESEQDVVMAVFTHRTFQLSSSMARHGGVPELSEVLARSSADAIHEIATGKRPSAAAAAEDRDDGAVPLADNFSANELICESPFLGACVAGHTRSMFTDPPEAAPLQAPATSGAVAYPLNSWVASQLAQDTEAETADGGLLCPVSCFPLLPNATHVTMVLPANPFSSNLVQPSKVHEQRTQVFPPRFAEWVVEWTAHLHKRLGEHGGYGPLWVWCQEASAQHSAPTQHGVPNWNTPEVIHTEDVADVMQHMSELRSGPHSARMRDSPLCKGDPRGEPVPPPPRTHVNFSDVSHVRVAVAGLTVRFTRLWQDELKAGVAQLLAAQKGRNLWMASSTVAPTAAWMKLAVSARDLCLMLPWCMTDPSCELAVSLGTVAVANHMERSQPVVRASARYPQYFDEEQRRYSAQVPAQRSVRVIMTDSEALSAPVLSEVFDVAASGVLAELHTLSKQPDTEAFAIGVQPIAVASSVFAAASNPVSMAERFAGAVDASLDMRVTGSGGGSFMQSALKDILRIVAANFREQSCLLHALPLLDARMMDKHMQVLMPGDEREMPMAHVAAPRRTVVVATPNTRRGAQQYSGHVYFEPPSDESATQRYRTAHGVPLQPTSHTGAQLHLREAAVLGYHPFNPQHAPYMSPSAVVPLASLQSFHAPADSPHSAMSSLTSTARMGSFMSAVDGIGIGSQLGSGVHVEAPGARRRPHAPAQNTGVFRFVQQERRVDLSAPLRQFDRPYPEEHEWVWMSKQLAADKLQLKQALAAHGYTSVFHAALPEPLPPPPRALRHRLFQNTPKRVPREGALRAQSPGASPHGGGQHWSGSEQFPDLMPDSASVAYQAGGGEEGGYTPPDMRPHMLALLRSVAAPAKQDAVSLDGVDCSPASVMDTASLILQRSIGAVQVGGAAPAGLLAQLQAVQAATEAATEAMAEAAAAAEEAAAEMSANNEMMANMLAKRLGR